MATATVKSKVELQINVTLELTIEEANALKEITAFGDRAFLDVFYKYLGKSTLQREEKGVISLFKTIKESLPQSINEANRIIRASKKLNNE